MRRDGVPDIIGVTKKGFNPRAYVRRDVVTSPPYNYNLSFNPRAYVRRDCFYTLLGNVLLCFNPRAYVRRDLVLI